MDSSQLGRQGNHVALFESVCSSPPERHFYFGVSILVFLSQKMSLLSNLGRELFQVTIKTRTLLIHFTEAWNAATIKEETFSSRGVKAVDSQGI